MSTCPCHPEYECCFPLIRRPLFSGRFACRRFNCEPFRPVPRLLLPAARRGGGAALGEVREVPAAVRLAAAGAGERRVGERPRDARAGPVAAEEFARGGGGSLYVVERGRRAALQAE